MTRSEFKKQVISFLRSPDDFIDVKGHILISKDNSTIELDLKPGENQEIWCIENGKEILAENWILDRLGKIDILAKAILDKIPEDPNYISMPCHVETLNEEKECEETLSSLIQQIDNHTPFVTNVFYIIAEAGEGKTWLMNRLAQKQAQGYLQRKNKWILLPIMLSGRPFLRLDEIIIGTLANHYRFNSYYIESCIELIRQGHIVLGLDGFEEMFVTGEEGEIISSLGSLLNRLDSSGTLICSTRKAYYKYANLETQAKLFDSFGSCDVDFTAYSLNKWGKDQFCQLMMKFGFNNNEASNCYNGLEQALTASHPILTRAFLARKLIEEIFARNGDVEKIVGELKKGDKSDAIEHFVNLLLDREADRWISRDEQRTVLLTRQQHDQLLESIAEEMWLCNIDSLKKDTMLSLTELTCADLNLLPIRIAQCKERILHHALLSPVDNGHNFSFCHEEFYAFFLGRVVGNMLIKQEEQYQIRRFFDKKILPELSIEETCKMISHSGSSLCVIEKLKGLSVGSAKTSCLNQNLTTILLRIISKEKIAACIENCYCSSWAISGLELSDINFDNCLVEQVDLNPQKLQNISFKNTDILEASFKQDKNNNQLAVHFDQQSIPHTLKLTTEAGETLCSYDPKEIVDILDNVSKANEHVTLEDAIHEDKKIYIFYKMVNYFLQNTGINENLLMRKMGVNWSLFASEILPIMLERQIVVGTEYRGQNHQRRYKLNIPIRILAEARKNCHGDFDELTKILTNLI